MSEGKALVVGLGVAGSFVGVAAMLGVAAPPAGDRLSGQLSPEFGWYGVYLIALGALIAPLSAWRPKLGAVLLLVLGVFSLLLLPQLINRSWLWIGVSVIWILGGTVALIWGGNRKGSGVPTALP